LEKQLADQRWDAAKRSIELEGDLTVGAKLTLTTSCFIMAGLDPNAPTPQDITVHQHSRMLEVSFSDGARFRIPFELLRIYSPSAEVQGHGPGQEVLQTGKREVEIVGLEPVGNYAVQPAFSDGHESGIFSWDYLYFLGAQQDELWRRYEARLAEAGVDRDAPMTAAGGGSACGHAH
jgi:DUF971 family protein